MKNFLFLPFILAVLQITELGCLWLDGDSLSLHRGTIQYNLKCCVATGLFQGETSRIASLLVPSLRRNASWFQGH